MAMLALLRSVACVGVKLTGKGSVFFFFAKRGGLWCVLMRAGTCVLVECL